MTLRMPSAELVGAPSLLSTVDRKLWAAICLVVLGTVALAPEVPWLATPPTEFTLPIDTVISAAMDWFVANFKWLFRALAWILSGPLLALTAIFQWLPWPATHIAGGGRSRTSSAAWRLAVFCAARAFLHSGGRLLGQEHEHRGAGRGSRCRSRFSSD